jgi:hypothetical protein
MLRLLEGRGDICVAFVCRRRRIYEGPIKAILQQAVYLTGGVWYMPISATGQPVRPRPALLAEQQVTSTFG